jgi:hypothetical protein
MEPVLRAIHAEASHARSIYGPPASTQEALGVLLEEFDELKDAIRTNDIDSIYLEAVQVASVAYRLAWECMNGGDRFLERSGLAAKEVV